MSTTANEPVVSKPTKRVYGWKRDLPSHHDNFLQVAHPTKSAKFPPAKFLGNLPPVYDQGQLGSCTANALAGCFEFEQVQQGLKDFMPSRLFIYYNERTLEGTVGTDSGAALSDGIKVLTQSGVCSENLWPYDISKFSVKPPSSAFDDASGHQVVASKRVPMNIEGFKTMINMGYPVSFGFTVFSYMESEEMAKHGILKMPGPREQPLGGHAVVCVGYSDNMKSADGKHTGFLKIRNSWGPDWGIEANGSKGYFWMPYDYVRAQLCSDAWVITKNEAALVASNKKMAEAVTIEDV
jgi:C1A family cysteine protease